MTMETITAQEARTHFARIPENSELCAECYHILELTDENKQYCPNEMCLNDEQG